MTRLAQTDDSAPLHRTARSSRRWLSPSATAPAHVTAQHPQLRDLVVSCAPHQDCVAHVSGRNLEILSFSGGSSTRRLGASQSRLPFKPNCLASGEGLLVAGGANTELSLRSLDEHYAFEDANFSVGASINNSVFIAPPVASTSRARLYCSNNDQTISVWDVVGPSNGNDASPRANLLRADLLPLNTAVNASALSPDGRMVVAVGDSDEVFLFEVQSNGKHRLRKTMKASNDSAFSVAWSRSSQNFAVASQDGIVSVFDIRQCIDSRASVSATRKDAGRIAAIATSNVGPYSSAARVVRYSPGNSPELLAFTEQCGFAHILDAQTYDESRAQHIFLSGATGSVSPSRAAAASRRSSVLDTDLAQIASLPANTGRALRLAALTPPLPPSEAGSTRRHARRLLRSSDSPTGADSPLSIALSYELASSEWSNSKHDTEIVSSPEVCGLTWSADGERLWIATETTISEFARLDGSVLLSSIFDSITSFTTVRARDPQHAMLSRPVPTSVQREKTTSHTRQSAAAPKIE